MTLNSKKGQGIILDMIVWMVVVVALAIISITLYPMFTDVKDALVEDPSFNNTPEAVSIITNAENQFPDIMDALTITILFFLAVGVVLSSFLIDTHPVFFIFGIIAFVIVAIIGGMLSETWTELLTDSAYDNIANDFPITNWVMTNFLLIIISYAPLMILSLFAKSRLR